MKGLLKCYYGYRNRGDEVLFFGVVRYVFDHYSDLTILDVEVGDASWMNQWCEMNPSWWGSYQDRVRFVPSRKLSMWAMDYDVIFAGGGEVLAQKGRNPRHAGFNYLALFWRWIWTKRMVWLGGIETPVTWWSKLLYRMMLPFAREIVCREQGSYHIATQYTDKVILYHDFAIDVLEEIKRANKMQKDSEKDLEKYVLINFIPKHTNQEIIDQFCQRIELYPDRHIISFPAEEGDVMPTEIMIKYHSRIQYWKRWEHDLSQNIALFQQADAGFGQRLHFIIPCVYYNILIHRLTYSEKVSKILEYFQYLR